MRPKILILSLFTSSILMSSSFTGVGFSSNNKEAKYEALSDLSMSIKAEVNAKIQNDIKVQEGQVTRRSYQSYEVRSKLPIIGAEYKTIEHKGSEIEVRAYLSSDKAKILYTHKLQSLFKEITSLEKRCNTVKSSTEKEPVLKMLLKTLDTYERYESVAIVLGVENIKEPSRNRAEVELELLALHSRIDSIALATSVLSDSFSKYKDIYIYPPKPNQSHEITAFGKLVKMNLKANIKSVYSPSESEYLLVGNYMQTSDGLLLRYTLLKTSTQESITSAIVSLLPKAYAKVQTVPKTLSFDKLLHAGVALSSDLRVQVATNKGSEDLLFMEGEEITLMVKLNKMGYYYVVGYTELHGKPYAYLIELNEAHGDAKFISFVNADDANKWIALGSYDVEAPLGVESLQVIASNHKIKSLPNHFFDKKNGYYKLGVEAKEAVSVTRGLKRKRAKESEMAESVLMFTTMKP